MAAEIGHIFNPFNRFFLSVTLFFKGADHNRERYRVLSLAQCVVYLPVIDCFW